MNLVQINEHLKDVPIQKLMEYANGKDPMVPAYMATGEMQRRESMQQRMAASQQAAQGQQPTVKEQVEQKAGLMALQAKQQQQAQQQMTQQAGQQPMPVPPGTPQPPMQEEEQPEFAGGGIARLPVRNDLFQFGSGGIIAFAAGNQVPVVEETEEEKRRRIEAGMAGPSLNDPLPQAQPGAEKPLNLQEILSDPAAKKAAMAALTPQQLAEINAQRLESRRLAGVQGEYGDEQRKRLAQEEEQYKEMLKDRAFNRSLAVLSGIGRGGLGGAAPAYLQTQAAEQAADIAQKRRMNQMYGDIDAKRREEAMAAATGMTAEEARQKGLAGTVGGQMFSTQMAGLASLETEKQRAKNAQELQQAKIASDEKIAHMSKETQERIAKLDRDLRVKLHSTPSATIDTTAVAAYVAAGMSPTEAYERVKTLSSGFKGEMTRDQAEDNVRQNMAAGIYMREISDLQKKAKEANVPFDIEAYMKKKVDERMANSGRSTMGRPAGTVDTSNPLLK